MIDENTTTLMGQLKNLQTTANTCAYGMFVIAGLLAAILWRLW
jgi:hypothetical protein